MKDLHLTLCLPGASQQASKALRELKELWLIHDPGRRPEAHAVSPRAIHAACHSTCFETEPLKLFRFVSAVSNRNQLYPFRRRLKQLKTNQNKSTCRRMFAQGTPAGR